MGLLNFFIAFSKFKLSLSEDEILNALTLILFKKSALSSSKGVERNVIFFFIAIFFYLFKIIIIKIIF